MKAVRCEYAYRFHGGDTWYPCQLGNGHAGEHKDGYGRPRPEHAYPWKESYRIKNENEDAIQEAQFNAMKMALFVIRGGVINPATIAQNCLEEIGLCQ